MESVPLAQAATRLPESAQDQRDIALCERAMEHRGEALSHEEFMAMLAREDAASA